MIWANIFPNNSDLPLGGFYPETGFWLTTVPVPPSFVIMTTGLLTLGFACRKNRLAG
jgi:hypothetical protein